MSIIKILARTIILLVCGIIQATGVLTEGLSKLLNQFGRYLSILDDKLDREVKQKKKNDKLIPT